LDRGRPTSSVGRAQVAYLRRCIAGHPLQPLVQHTLTRRILLATTFASSMKLSCEVCFCTHALVFAHLSSVRILSASCSACRTFTHNTARSALAVNSTSRPSPTSLRRWCLSRGRSRSWSPRAHQRPVRKVHGWHLYGCGDFGNSSHLPAWFVQLRLHPVSPLQPTDAVRAVAHQDGIGRAGAAKVAAAAGAAAASEIALVG
jgi:hypothetical protein